MFEILSFIGEFASFIFELLLWVIFWSFVFGIVRRVLSNTDEEAETEEMVNKVMTKIHQIKQEQHGDLYYWFDKDTDAFLAQGSTDEEIKQHLKQRFKGHIFLLDDKRALAGPDLTIVPIADLPKRPELVPKI